MFQHVKKSELINERADQQSTEHRGKGQRQLTHADPEETLVRSAGLIDGGDRFTLLSKPTFITFELPYLL